MEGRVSDVLNQFFLIQHHASTDKQSMLFDQLLPNRHLSDKHELFIYFECTHSNNIRKTGICPGVRVPAEIRWLGGAKARA